MAEPTQPAERMIVAYFIVSDDVERSRRFYTEVLGGTVVFGPEPTNIAVANSFIVINAGGGPTDDKPTVTLETPSDPDRVSSFLNIRVTNIHAVYAEWSARGAHFLTPPKQHQYETRCYNPGSRRLHHRGRANHRPTGRLVARRLATAQPRRPIRVNPVSSVSRSRPWLGRPQGRRQAQRRLRAGNVDYGPDQVRPGRPRPQGRLTGASTSS